MIATAAEPGDGASQWIPVVYTELRRLARHYMSRERANHTLQPTALVNEAYLRLADQPLFACQNRAHLIGVAANLMRRILVDHARHHKSLKNPGRQQQVDLSVAELHPQQRGGNGQVANVLDIDNALEVLAKVDPRQSRIVELRYFGGLTIEETAEVVGISEKTVKRDWQIARAWLFKQLQQ